MNEILSYKRKINVFDAWCYIASFSENKHHYLKYEHNLDYVKAYYNWITIGFLNFYLYHLIIIYWLNKY